MKTDGIYRYREDAPPKHVERWWHEGLRAVETIVVVTLVMELRQRGFDGWLWAPLIIIGLNLLDAAIK
jgi:hypothetical protein